MGLFASVFGGQSSSTSTSTTNNKTATQNVSGAADNGAFSVTGGGNVSLVDPGAIALANNALDFASQANTTALDFASQVNKAGVSDLQNAVAGFVTSQSNVLATQAANNGSLTSTDYALLAAVALGAMWMMFG